MSFADLVKSNVPAEFREPEVTVRTFG
jgi:hypothetical protein